jgi:hypothetical protein
MVGYRHVVREAKKRVVQRPADNEPDAQSPGNGPDVATRLRLTRRVASSIYNL